MHSLGVPKHHRLISRVCFYALVFLLFWILGMITPRSGSARLQSQAGATQTYITVIPLPTPLVSSELH